MNKIVYSDNLPILEQMRTESIDLIYIDPPFNSGKRQQKTSIRTTRDDDEHDRRGFGGKTYKTTVLGTTGFDDSFDDYLGFLKPRLEESHRLLSPSGSFFLHVDFREVHYCKILLDTIFGRDSFINEIIWAYDFGGRSTNRWPTKHNNILWYAKNPKDYTFNYDEMDRIPYMAPGLAGSEKASKGKTPTDVWWHTIVHTNGKEKTGYATQKPLGIINRIVKIHSNPGDTVLDFFAGSGTLGEAAALHGRKFILIDSNPEAIHAMEKRLADFTPVFENWEISGNIVRRTKTRRPIEVEN